MTGTSTKPVIVTTEHKGVFFGYAPAEIYLHPADSKALTLTDAQMCVYWSEDVKGILGLASDGPTKGCRVTRPVSKMTVTEVTAVMDASDKAVTAWQDRPWS